MYAMVVTRLDIIYLVGVVSKFMHNPCQLHWNVVKHVLSYLVCTQDHNILFGPNQNLGLISYIDSNFAICVDC